MSAIFNIRTGEFALARPQRGRQDHDVAHGGRLLRPDAGDGCRLCVATMRCRDLSQQADDGVVSDETDDLRHKLTPLAYPNRRRPLGIDATAAESPRAICSPRSASSASR